MNRCIICDYTVEEGSDFAYRSPGISKVRQQTDGEFLCSECEYEAEENLQDLGSNDIDPEEV